MSVISRASCVITFILHFALAYFARNLKGPLVAIPAVVNCFISHFPTQYQKFPCCYYTSVTIKTCKTLCLKTDPTNETHVPDYLYNL